MTLVRSLFALCFLCFATEAKIIKYKKAMFEAEGIELTDTLVEIRSEKEDSSDLDITSLMEDDALTSTRDVEALLDSLSRYEGPKGGKCKCTLEPLECECTATFRIHIRWVHTWHFKVETIFQVLHRETFGVDFRVLVNGHKIYNKEISLRNPPPICAERIPGISKLGNFCLQIYNIDIIHKSACIRVIVKVWVITKHFNLYCFKLPIADEDAIANDTEGMLKLS